MADWNLESTWREWTGFTQHRLGKPRYGEYLSYIDGRDYAMLESIDLEGEGATYRHYLTRLGATPNFNPATDILIAGCGFGWLVEYALAAGSNDVWGTDISTLIHSLIGNPSIGVPTAVADRVLNIDVTATDAADQFKAAGAGNNRGLFNWVITEQMLTDYSDAELPAILSACEDLQSNPGGLIHIVTATDSWSSGVNTIIPTPRTLTEWVAFAPTHYWMDYATGEIRTGT